MFGLGRSQRFPAFRAQLYDKALRILLEEWAADKGIMQGDIYDGLSTELEEVLLAEIACTHFVKDQLFFTRRELVDAIKTFLANTLDAPQHLDGEKVLDTITIQQGIFVERAEDAYTFSHLTLQEYLTAQYIVDHQQIQQLVTNHLFDQRWREVFLLVSGLMRGSVEILLAEIEKAAREKINTQKLRGLIFWAEQITKDSAGMYKSAAKRTIAIHIALNRKLNLNPIQTYDLNLNQTLIFAINLSCSIDSNLDKDLNLFKALKRSNGSIMKLDRNVDCAIDIVRTSGEEQRSKELDSLLSIDYEEALNIHVNRALELQIVLEKLKIFRSLEFTDFIKKLQALESNLPRQDQPVKIRVDFIETIIGIWCKTFQLDPDYWIFSQSEQSALGSYFYANELMVKCKESAVRVSPRIWKELEAQMVTVKEV
ncbi:MAG: hypothetical protein F6K16_42660 [Symploca sp. SIO2B6]|nr:hypothetical protein [Symploca sp. SIO2B6]